MSKVFDRYIKAIKTKAKILEEIGTTRPILDIKTKEGAKYPNGTSVAQVFAWQEYGTDRIAPKAFVRQTYSDNCKRYGLSLGRNLKKVMEGKLSMIAALDRMASSMAEDIRKACPVDTGMLRDSLQVTAYMEGVNND